MRFENPMMFHLFWLVGLSAVFLFYGYKQRRKRLEVFIESKLHSSMARNLDQSKWVLKNILIIVVFIFSVIALARPQWGFEWQEIKREGVDIIIAVDASRSMLATDVKPNRLERTKLAIQDLLKKIQGDRIGLIAFSGNAFMVCPLTVDVSGFSMSLKEMDTNTVSRGGTNIGEAIKEALKSYDQTPSRYKAVVIITDGDNLEGDPLVQAQKAKELGVRIYTIGIGTADGELIQLENENGTKEFLKDEAGNFVKSRLNEKLLKEIALKTNGAYVRASGAEFGLDTIYEQEISKFEKRELKTKMDKRYFERFQIPLAIAVLLLVIELCIPTRRIIRDRHLFSFKNKCLSLIIILLLFCSSSAWAASKQTEVKKGNAHYLKGEFDQSIEKYKEALKKDPESDIINFDLGTALYKKGEFKEAQEHLAKTLLSDEKDLKQKAFYNLGNSFYKSGIALEEKNMDQAILDVTESVKHLESAVGLNAEDQEAKHNYTFVQKELERLKKKQEEQKDSKFCPNPKKDEGGNKDQKSDDQKSEQSKSEDKKSEEQKSEVQPPQNQNQSQPEPSSSDQKEKKEEKQADEKKAESKSAEEQKKDEKDSKEQSAQNASSAQPAGEGKNAEQSVEAKDARELTEKESKMLLENYEQNEAPKGMFQMKLQRREQRPVGKDW